MNNEDLDIYAKLAALNAKFPITNSSIQDNSINESKIINLVSDLAAINTLITAL